jgi:hypothetical protein
MKASDWHPQSTMDQYSVDDSDDVLHTKENQSLMNSYAGDLTPSI